MVQLKFNLIPANGSLSKDMLVNLQMGMEKGLVPIKGSDTLQNLVQDFETTQKFIDFSDFIEITIHFIDFKYL